ncbi:hypothetical protein NKDENANG_02999 [Candidatus Entotheonellaceae bacterium PAL068K]
MAASLPVSPAMAPPTAPAATLAATETFQRLVDMVDHLKDVDNVADPCRLLVT